MHIKEITFIIINPTLVLIGFLSALLMLNGFVALVVEPFTITPILYFNDVIKLVVGAFLLVISDHISRKLTSF